MVNLEKSFSGNQWKGWYEVFLDIGGWYCSGNKFNYGGWYPFHSYVNNRYMFTEFILELVALAVKSSWADGDIFMSIFMAFVLWQHYKQY